MGQNDSSIGQLKYSLHNKSYLDNIDSKFNISHTRDIVICAIQQSCDIGIDIEGIVDLNFKEFKSQMLISEWKKLIVSNDLKKSFFNYWAQKEAVIKAHGNGLSIPLKSFEIIDDQTKINGLTYFLNEIELHSNKDAFWQAPVSWP